MLKKHPFHAPFRSNKLGMLFWKSLLSMRPTSLPSHLSISKVLSTATHTSNSTKQTTSSPRQDTRQKSITQERAGCLEKRTLSQPVCTQPERRKIPFTPSMANGPTLSSFAMAPRNTAAKSRRIVPKRTKSHR